MAKEHELYLADGSHEDGDNDLIKLNRVKLINILFDLPY